ncbi:MAG: transglycosylase SLT domain-containing protein [Pyrinomonadaceae bacterium]|nr:transglycosylase SLT domain-containing protein [Pyrinomonadaceae bacterium]
MFRKLIYILIALVLLSALGAAGYYFGNQYWIHRYDDLIERQAKVYRLNEDFVWSIIHEESYFSGWKIGADAEVGLMQVTPTVAREWAKKTGLKEFEKRTAENVQAFLKEPERNIQVGCWYLESLSERYRDFPAEKAMTLAAYNAGASRVEEWTKDVDASRLSEKEFISRIKISSTKAYVSSILKRYRQINKGRIR